MKRLSALLIATAAFVGCDQVDRTPQAPAVQADVPQAKPVGNLIKEFRITNETSVRFQENNGVVSYSLEGHVDEKDINQPLEDKLFKATTMEAAYRVMDPAGPVPQAILDFDKRPAAVENSAPVGSEAAGPGAAPAAVNVPLAKANGLAKTATDAGWDWTADANWWMGTVVGYPCGWHQAAYYTNVTWADDWRRGWFDAGYLMAASMDYGANAYAYIWRNGAWVLTNSYYLTPRHYIIWYSGDKTQQYRRYRVEGYGGAMARIHWGMRWDTQAPSDLGVICES